jgi:non-specific protein-tyrosine kinase
MNLVEYGRILLRRGWIMLLLAALTAGAAYFLSAQETPVYRSTVKVLVVPARTDNGLTLASKSLLNQFREYLNSSLIAREVIDKLQLDMTPDELMSTVTIAADDLSMSLQIDVDLTDGDLANRLARAWGEELVLYRNEENQKNRREDRVDARLQDDPRYGLLRPRPAINAAAGGVLGLLLGGIIVFILEFLESSIVRHRDDVERTLDLPVLATIPDSEG